MSPAEGWTCAEAEGDDLPRWERLLADSPQRGPFSSEAWLTASCRLTGGSALRLLVRKGTEPVGAAALHVRKGPAGTEVSPPPFSMIHTPCWKAGAEEGSARRVHQLLAGSAVLAGHLERRYAAAALDLHPTLVDVRPFLWRGWKARVRYTWQVPMGDLEGFRRSCSEDVRHTVRRAEGLSVTAAEGGDMGEAVDLWLQTADRRHIGRVADRDALVAFFASLRASGVLALWIARQGGRALSAAWILGTAGRRGYLLAANSREGLESGANALLLWRLAESLCMDGAEGGVLDLCGADYPTISIFKGKFGGRLVPFHRVEKAVSLRARLRALLA